MHVACMYMYCNPYICVCTCEACIHVACMYMYLLIYVHVRHTYMWHACTCDDDIMWKVCTCTVAVKKMLVTLCSMHVYITP